MIDGRLLRRLLGGAGVLFLLAAGAALAIGRADVALGLALGYVLGAVPFASWAWIASRGFATARGRVLVVLLLAGKMALYSGLLYLLVTRELASPAAVMIGITGVAGILCVGSLMIPSPGKEAAKC
jgi:hypothetical protein